MSPGKEERKRVLQPFSDAETFGLLFIPKKGSLFAIAKNIFAGRQPNCLAHNFIKLNLENFPSLLIN
jgi:hypothetical protein